MSEFFCGFAVSGGGAVPGQKNFSENTMGAKSFKLSGF